MRVWLAPQDSISDTEIDRGLAMLLWDGMFAQVMAVLTTGAFLVGFALALDASNTLIGLLAAIAPFLQTLQLPSIYLIERLRARKAIAVSAFAASRLVLLAIAALPIIASSRLALPLFLMLLACHHGLAALGNCALNSWIRDLIPPERVERFFARRLASATLVGAVLSFAGGMSIDILKSRLAQGETTAYSVLFAAGSVAGLISVFALSQMPEPVMPSTGRFSLRAVIAEPIRDLNFRNLLIFLAAWSFAVNFAAPFFAVYLLSRLGISMTWVLVLSVLSQMFNVLFFNVWGRLAERFSNKSVLLLSVPLFFVTFLMWPFTTLPDPHLLTFPILIAIHVLAGISAAGVGLCAGNLALKSAPYGKGAAYLAVNALVSGAAATVAPILAGLAADGFSRYEARLTLSLLNLPDSEIVFEFPTLDLRGMDFLFVLAFIFGMYSLHRLLAVKEEGEVTEKVLREAIVTEARRAIRQISTVAGVRSLLMFPYAQLQVLARRVGGTPEQTPN